MFLEIVEGGSRLQWRTSRDRLGDPEREGGEIDLETPNARDRLGDPEREGGSPAWCSYRCALGTDLHSQGTETNETPKEILEGVERLTVPGWCRSDSVIPPLRGKRRRTGNVVQKNSKCNETREA